MSSYITSGIILLGAFLLLVIGAIGAKIYSDYKEEKSTTITNWYNADIFFLGFGLGIILSYLTVFIESIVSRNKTASEYAMSFTILLLAGVLAGVGIYNINTLTKIGKADDNDRGQKIAFAKSISLASIGTAVGLFVAKIIGLLTVIKPIICILDIIVFYIVILSCIACSSICIHLHNVIGGSKGPFVFVVILLVVCILLLIGGTAAVIFPPTFAAICGATESIAAVGVAEGTALKTVGRAEKSLSAVGKARAFMNRADHGLSAAHHAKTQIHAGKIADFIASKSAKGHLGAMASSFKSELL